MPASSMSLNICGEGRSIYCSCRSIYLSIMIDLSICDSRFIYLSIYDLFTHLWLKIFLYIYGVRFIYQFVGRSICLLILIDYLSICVGNFLYVVEDLSIFKCGGRFIHLSVVLYMSLIIDLSLLIYGG